MDTPSQPGLEPAPQQQSSQPQYSSPPPSSGIPTGQVLIALVVLIVGGGIVWALSKDSGQGQVLQTATPQNTGSQQATPTPTNNTPGATKTATPNPTQTPSISAFVGRWSGRFNGVDDECPDGNVTFDVSSNGNLQGTATTDYLGIAYGGGGNVSAAGNISGGWTYGPARLNLTGKLLTSGTGSGTYSESEGCSGTFSVRR